MSLRGYIGYARGGLVYLRPCVVIRLRSDRTGTGIETVDMIAIYVGINLDMRLCTYIG